MDRKASFQMCGPFDRVFRLLRGMAVLCVLLFACAATAAAAPEMSQSNLTLTAGGSQTLKVVSGGSAVSASWRSSDTSVATVSSGGKVKGVSAGSARIIASVNGRTVECPVSVLRKTSGSTQRYNVLILDCSSSMQGTPFEKQKESAVRFCETLLKSEGNNYVALMYFGSNVYQCTGFTDSLSELKRAINSRSATEGTDTEAALAKAGALMDGVAASGSNVMKNIILCSDGLPQRGSRLYSGRYSSSDYSGYSYANAAYQTDSKLKKKGYFIYTLGFFHKLTGRELEFGKRFMKDLASSGAYTIVQDPEDMDQVLDSIAEKITLTLKLNKSSATIKVKGSVRLTAYLNNKKTKASWKSSNKKVAKVSSSGKVTGKKAGTVTITATCKGKTAKCKVKVTAPAAQVKKVKLNKKIIFLKAGKSYTLSATVTPSNASGKGITWSSSRKTVASVSKNGKVTARSVGLATVTAKASNGKKDSCKVLVIPSGSFMFYYDGHYYVRFDVRGKTWQQAKAYCEKLGGHLATVTSYAEQQVISKMVQSGTRNCYWLGGYRSGGRWCWVTGETFGYTNWASGQPNDMGGIEDSLMIHRLTNPMNGNEGPGTWNDLCHDGRCGTEEYFGTDNFGFICEWEW